MKTTLILAVITILSLGTLALVRAQDAEAIPPGETNPDSVETKESVPQVAGIRTEVALEEKLLGGTEEVTVIPVAGIFAEGDRFFVLAKGAESEIDFRETEVTLGDTDGLNVEIKSGLFPGDEVVIVSVGQLRFPAFDDGETAVCGVGGCATASCDLATGSCGLKGKEGEACNLEGDCKKNETGKVTCAECENCKSGVACDDCSDCPAKVDRTISADEFFNSSLEVVFESTPGFFMGEATFCPPY